MNTNKQIEFLKDFGGRDKYFTKKKDLRIGDCSIRACAIATGTEYFETMKELFKIGLEMKRLPNSDTVTEQFLTERGFVKRSPKKIAGTNKRYRVAEFPAEPNKVYVIRTSNHLTVIDQLLHRDSWNCGAWAAQSYYEK